MGFIAFAAPILPGKTEQFKRFIDELNGPRSKDFKESRQKAGVMERTFLQNTPQGDMVVVTLEGNDPIKSFGEFARGKDSFSQWFRQQVMDIHGLDLAQIDKLPMPRMIAETDPVSTGSGQKRQAA